MLYATLRNTVDQEESWELRKSWVGMVVMAVSRLPTDSAAMQMQMSGKYQI